MSRESSQNINISLRKNDYQRKRNLHSGSGRNRTRSNTSLNSNSSSNSTSSTSNGNNEKNLKSLNVQVENNNLKSFKNQNFHYNHKNNNSNLRDLEQTESTISKVQCNKNIPPTIPNNQNLLTNSHKETTNQFQNNLKFNFNQRPPSNGFYCHQHLPISIIPTYQNNAPLSPQISIEPWNRNMPSGNIFMSNHQNNNIGKKIYTEKTCSNTTTKQNGTNNMNSDQSSTSSQTNSNSRVKSHQNHSNLTYVVTNKENIFLPTETKNTLSLETQPISNLKVASNPVSKSLPNIKIFETESKNLLKNELEDEKIKEKVMTPSQVAFKLDPTIPQFNYNLNSVESPINPITHVIPHYIFTTAPPQTDFPNSPNMRNYVLHGQNFPYFNHKPNMNTYNFYSPNKVNIHQTENSSNSCQISSDKKTKKTILTNKKSCTNNLNLKSFHIPVNTPPDRFLRQSNKMEIKETPKNLITGSKWDKLSLDLWNKFLTNQQKESTYQKKILLWKFLYLSIKRNFPRYGLYLVGSTITGFGTNCSDVDMCLVHRVTYTSVDSRYEAISHLNVINDYLKTLGIFERFHLIEAKVPILRFCDPNNLIEVDLNFNNSVGIRNTHLLYCYSQMDWRLKPLVVITKLWARYHNINNAKTMTISSYSLVLMVIHFLQFAVNPPVLPCLHELYPEKFKIILTSNEFGYVDMIEELPPYKSENNQSLGELCLSFLEYYSNFDYTKYAISVRTGKLLPIEECRNAISLKNDIHSWKQLCIEEPFDLTNTARSVYDCETFDKIKNVFIMSWRILQNTLDINQIFLPLYYHYFPQEMLHS